MVLKSSPMEKGDEKRTLENLSVVGNDENVRWLIAYLRCKDICKAHE